MKDIKLSICCITYNQEEYIRKAIDSFLMQKVDFTIEILIHDDASTDKTSKIIKEYENKYPDIIKPIYQTENQYSKNMRVSDFNTERAKGKYIALCEGDDYWTDPYKLQKQVDYLENNPEYSLVVHGARRVNAIDDTIIDYISPYKSNKVVSVEEIIVGGGGLFPTNSMVFRSSYAKIMPTFYNNAPVGDYPLCVYLSFMGKVYYIAEFMSDYRSLVPGSWTSKQAISVERRINYYKKTLRMLDEINLYSNSKYSNVIERRKDHNKFNLLIEQGKFIEAKNNHTLNYYSSLKFETKLKINIKQYCPKLSKFLIKVKRNY